MLPLQLNLFEPTPDRIPFTGSFSRDFFHISREYVPPYEVSEKLIISGLYVEHYSYERSYWVGWPKERTYSSKLEVSHDQEQIRSDNVHRTKVKIRRLVNSNQDLVKFMTLTFDSEVVSLEVANRLFNQFIKRLTRLTLDFKYLAVPEFQKKGRVHYHVLCNLPFIQASQLERVWSHGFVFIRKVNNVNNLGSYISKYLGKANFDTRLFRKRKFFYSFNLLRPLVVDKLKEVQEILSNLPINIEAFCKKVFSLPILTKFLGVIQYNCYKLSDIIKVV